MNIETKFNVNEEVYMIIGSKLVVGTVEEIVVVTFGNPHTMLNAGMTIHYNVGRPNKVPTRVEEKNLFKTKKGAMQELVKRNGYEVSEDNLIEIKD